MSLAALALVAYASTAWAGTLCTYGGRRRWGGAGGGRAGLRRARDPASTSKIALGLIGFDAGIVVDEHNPAWPFREGYADWVPSAGR